MSSVQFYRADAFNSPTARYLPRKLCTLLQPAFGTVLPEAELCGREAQFGAYALPRLLIQVKDRQCLPVKLWEFRQPAPECHPPFLLDGCLILRRLVDWLAPIV